MTDVTAVAAGAKAKPGLVAVASLSDRGPVEAEPYIHEISGRGVLTFLPAGAAPGEFRPLAAWVLTPAAMEALARSATASAVRLRAAEAAADGASRPHGNGKPGRLLALLEASCAGDLALADLARRTGMTLAEVRLAAEELERRGLAALSEDGRLRLVKARAS